MEHVNGERKGRNPQGARQGRRKRCLMAKTSMTRKDALTIAIAEVANPEAVAVLEKMLAQISKPRTSTPSKSAARVLNERIAHELAGMYETGSRITCSKVIAGSPYLGGEGVVITPQKAVGVMAVACEFGDFVKVKEGKQTLYERL